MLCAPRLSALAAALTAALTCACQGAGTAEPGPDLDGADETKPAFDRMRALLDQGSLDRPPLAKDFDVPLDAIQIEISVIEDGAFELGTLAAPKVAELMDGMGVPDNENINPLVAHADTDTALSMNMGFDEPEAKSYFINKLTRQKFRKDMRAILDSGARYFRLSVGNTAAEMVGGELWLIGSLDGAKDRVLVIEMAYSEIF